MLIPNRSNPNTTAVESRSRLERSSVIEPESISFLLSFSPCQPRGARQVPFSIMSVTCCSGHSTHGAISYSEMLFSVCSMRIVSKVHWCGRRIVHRRGFLWVAELTHLHGDNAQSDLARKNCGRTVAQLKMVSLVRCASFEHPCKFFFYTCCIIAAVLCDVGYSSSSIDRVIFHPICASEANKLPCDHSQTCHAQSSAPA